MIERDHIFGEYTFKCPYCDNNNVHHESVEVFERENEEDGKSFILKPGSSFVKSTGRNPSSRRNAVNIDFWGECGHKWTINIIQHKGMTYIKHDV